MYYIILSTDLPDGRMSPIRMSHYDTGSDSLESTLGVKADSSMIIQVHQDTLRTLDTGYIQNSYYLGVMMCVFMDSPRHNSHKTLMSRSGSQVTHIYQHTQQNIQNNSLSEYQ